MTKIAESGSISQWRGFGFGSRTKTSRIRNTVYKVGGAALSKEIYPF